MDFKSEVFVFIPKMSPFPLSKPADTCKNTVVFCAKLHAHWAFDYAIKDWVHIELAYLV